MISSALTLLALAAWRGTFVLGAALALLDAFPRAAAATRHTMMRVALSAQLILLAVPAALPWHALGAPPLRVFEMVAPDRDRWVQTTDWPVNRTLIIVLGALCLVVTATLLARTFYGFVIQRRIAGHLLPVGNARAVTVAHEIAREMGLSLTPLVAASPLVDGPATWGWRTHVVVVPIGAAEWTLDRWNIVLRHELAHVARRDTITQLVARIVTAIFWFNPLVWLCARCERSERERACDDAVVCSGISASDYVEHVVAIVRQQRRLRSPGLALGSAHGVFEERMLAALDTARSHVGVPRNAARPRGIFVTLSVAMGIAMIAASLQSPAGAQQAAANIRALTPFRIDAPGPCHGSIVLHQCAVLDSAGNVTQQFRVVRDVTTPSGRVIEEH